MMRTIALLTDFGTGSFYAGIMRAVLGAGVPGAVVVDITHDVAPHAVDQAGFVLDCVLDWFPPGTVVVAVVDPGVGGERRNLVVETGGRFVVAPDNGIAGDVASRLGVSRAVVIDESRIRRYRRGEATGRTFLGRDVFAPVGAALAAGADIGSLGPDAGGLSPAPWLPDVEVSDGRIRARARYVDAFGNVMTAIGTRHLDAAFPGVSRERIEAAAAGRPAGRLRRYYTGAPAGALIAVVNSWNRVEISIDQGRAIDAFAGTPLASLAVELRRHEE